MKNKDWKENSRIIFLDRGVNESTASSITKKLISLSLKSDKDITLFINSPGGIVTAGFAIHDVMNSIPCDVRTVSMGLSASMGSFLLAAGTKGKRYALPNTEIMIHQVSGGFWGDFGDITIRSNHLKKTGDHLNRLLSENTGRTIKEIEKAVNRDNFLTAKEALEFGLVDHIVTSLSEVLK